MLGKRMARARDYPPRLMAGDCVPLDSSLQPGFVSVQEPVAAFPMSGFYKDGVYYEVRGCKGNIVNVRSASPFGSTASAPA